MLSGWFTEAVSTWQPGVQATDAAIRVVQAQFAQNETLEVYWFPVALHHWSAMPPSLQSLVIVDYAVARNLPSGIYGTTVHTAQGLPVIPFPSHSWMAQWIFAYGLWAHGQFAAANRQWQAVGALPSSMQSMTDAYLSVVALETNNSTPPSEQLEQQRLYTKSLHATTRHGAFGGRECRKPTAPGTKTPTPNPRENVRYADVSA